MWDSLSSEEKRALINDRIDDILRHSRDCVEDMLSLRRNGKAITSRNVTNSPHRPWDPILRLCNDAPWTRETIMWVCYERSDFAHNASRAIAGESWAETGAGRFDQVEEFKYRTFEAALLKRLAQAAAGYEHHIDHLLHIAVVRRWGMLEVEGYVDKPHLDMTRNWSIWAASLECCGGEHGEIGGEEVLQAEQEHISGLEGEQGSQEYVMDSTVQMSQFVPRPELPDLSDLLAEQGSWEPAEDSDVKMEGMEC